MSALTTGCPVCAALPGHPCKSRHTHFRRLVRATRKRRWGIGAAPPEDATQGHPSGRQRVGRGIADVVHAHWYEEDQIVHAFNDQWASNRSICGLAVAEPGMETGPLWLATCGTCRNLCNVTPENLRRWGA